jgi:undecaprenyl-diphosphatase
MNKKNLWLIAVPLILFTMLAICIRAGITVNFEGWAYNESIEHVSPSFTKIVKAITHTGDSVVLITFCLLLFVIPKSRKTIALPISVTVILSMILDITLKSIFARERPDILRLINETSYSFPSGHAMNNAALYTILILLIFKFIKNKPLKIVLVAVCITLTIAIGYSRIYLGVHYAGDVLGGWLLGPAISIFIYLTWNRKFGFVDKKTMH